MRATVPHLLCQKEFVEAQHHACLYICKFLSKFSPQTGRRQRHCRHCRCRRSSPRTERWGGPSSGWLTPVPWPPCGAQVTHPRLWTQDVNIVNANYSFFILIST